VTEDQLTLLLEAARWAPSAGNSQPWSFIAGRRGDANHVRIARYLARSSAAWALRAGLLVVNLCHRFVEDTDWNYSEFSTYDLGQAVAHMTFQALSMGIAAHQFRAFDKDGVTREFALPPHWEVSTMTAFGVVLDQAPGPRARRETRDLLWPTTERSGVTTIDFQR
jgi:nitroreductase